MNWRDFYKRFKKTLIQIGIATLLLGLLTFFTIITLKIREMKQVEYYGQPSTIINERVRESMPNILLTATINSLITMVSVCAIMLFLELFIEYGVKPFRKSKYPATKKTTQSHSSTYDDTKNKGIHKDIKETYTKYRKTILRGSISAFIFGFGFALRYALTNIKLLRSMEYISDSIALKEQLVLSHESTIGIILTAIPIGLLISVGLFVLNITVSFRREYNIYVFYEIKQYLKGKRHQKDTE
ncbi:MAG: hypothetical protein LBM69_10520 [Lachnospiraceae bacterium]|jgi:hypothetical protein|nr:hypothetical protein [Lachnospiraceae bacterium]